MGREDELLERFRDAGDDGAMEALVDMTRPRLVGVARRIGSPQDAEDSVQAAYHALLRRAEPPDDVVGWLVATVVRIAYRQKAAGRREATLAERLGRGRDGPDAARGAARDEEDALVRTAVHRLPARYRDAVVLHHLEGVPLADVARLLDVPEATAKTRVRRGRALLRMRLPASLAIGLFALPWLLADAVRALGASSGLILGGTMNAKAAVAVFVVVAFGVGTGVGVAVSSPDAASPVAPPAAADGPSSSRTTKSAPETARAPEERRAERPPRAEPGQAFSLDDVRKVVREELQRGGAAAADPAEAAATTAADPALNADPARRRAVADTVSATRRAFIEYDLRYNVGPTHEIAAPDATRLESYPDDAWPSRPLGWIETKPERYELLDAAAKGFSASRERGAFAFTAALAKPIVCGAQQSLVFFDGVAAEGVVTMQSYGSVQCRGAMRGKLVFDSYATAVFEGDVPGSVVTNSYTSILVRGDLSGSIKTDSYANIVLLGGFTGTMDLHDGGAVYFGGYVPQSALDRVKTRGRATFVFESTDLPAGKHGEKSRSVTVLERK